MTKLDCFPPSAFSLRSNFPKLVFGHLHFLKNFIDLSMNFSMNEILSLILMQFSCSSILLSTPNQLHLLKPFQQCSFYNFLYFCPFWPAFRPFMEKSQDNNECLRNTTKMTNPEVITIGFPILECVKTTSS